MKWVRKAAICYDKVIFACFLIGLVSLPISVLAVNTGIIGRSVFGTAGLKGWSLEIMAYSMLYITFLGSAWTLREGKHPTMDLLISAVKPRTRWLLNAFTKGVSTIMWLILAWYGTLLVHRLFVVGEVIPTEWEPLKGAIVVGIPIGCYLLFIQCARETLKSVRSWRGSHG